MSAADIARRHYAKTAGQSFGNHAGTFQQEANVAALIAEGFLVKVNGRCGFEVIPDAMLQWTSAAHAAFGAEHPGDAAAVAALA